MPGMRASIAEFKVSEFMRSSAYPLQNRQKALWETVNVDLPTNLRLSLQALAKQEGTTLFLTLLTAFLTLLHRYSCREDALVGPCLIRRIQSKDSSTVESVLEELSLLQALAQNPPFRELLCHVSENAALAGEEFTLTSITQHEHEASTDSLQASSQIRIAVVLQHRATTFHDSQAGAPALLSAYPQMGSADLVLSLALFENGLQGHLHYNPSLFDRESIEKCAGHFCLLLSSIVDDPDRRVATLTLLTEDERQELLITWNKTSEDYPETCPLHELFEAQVARVPDSPAVVFGEEQLTYQQLNHHANQLAHRLLALGIGTESIVGVFMERSIDVVIGLLGILKAGGAYLPLDPEYPKQRLTFMLEDAQPAVILTQHKWINHLPTADCHVLCLDVHPSPFANEEHIDPSVEVALGNLMYVMHTSGSTGRPKGVLLSHRGACNRILWMQHTYKIGSQDRILQKTPFSFDVSVWEFFLPLVTGALLVIAQPEGHKDCRYLVDLIKSQGITTIHFVPSMLQVFLETDDLEQCTSLYRVFCSGEALSVELQQKFFKRWGAQLYNLYGPTEASIDVTHWTCERAGKRNTVPIGRPIANTQIYILDKYLNPVPVGVVGELHIGGCCLARGYLKRPDLTEEKFIPNPFDATGTTRLYKTGDLACYQPDGTIEFLGRIDHQVKIRGFRIELGEIEAILDAHPVVRKSIVLAQKDDLVGTHLVGYIVPDAVPPPPAGTLLRDYLRLQLPEYMIPSSFRFLETIPLTSSGKVDRRALLESTRSLDDRVSMITAFRTPIEQHLADIWADVLLQKPGGPSDNFFEMGGHSLLATQVISRIRKIFHIDLPIRTFFEHPVLADVANIIETALSKRQYLQTSPLKRSDRNQALELSFAQQRLWFLQQLEPQSSSYNLLEAMHLFGPIHTDVLEACIGELVNRHESFRTTFSLIDDRPVQVIEPAKHQQSSLNLLSILHSHTEAMQFLKEEAKKPFDLTRGPLLRTHLIQIGDEEHILIFNMHHIISDGWSSRVLKEELALLWNASLQGDCPTLPDLDIQYADYADWQKRWLEGDASRTQLAYWREQLAGAPASLDLPMDQPRPNRLSHQADIYNFSLSEQLVSSLSLFCRKLKVTLFMTLLAVFNIILSRYSGQEDIIVGVPIAGRNFAEVENIIGFFVNTLALRTDLSGNPSFLNLLHRVRDCAMGAYSHQDIPFEKLVADLRPRRNANRLPLFQVMFNFQEALRPLPAFSGIEQRRVVVENQMTKVDLKLDALETMAGLTCSIEYSKELFSRDRIATMTKHLSHLLHQVVDDPHKKISEYVLRVDGNDSALRSQAERP